MNFFKRKFSFTDDEGDPNDVVVAFDDPIGPSPPSAFSFQAIAHRMSNTISAPTSPARGGDSLVAALEKALQDRSRGQPVMPPDAKILLVIDNQIVDWSKYFRNPQETPVRVEQADFSELDLMCTEHSCIVEINQPDRDSRSFTPDACFIGAGATKSSLSKTILRSLIAANIPFLNSHSSMVAFMDRNNLKKQLRKVHYTTGQKIPFLPSIHYPHFQKFHSTTNFPAVISVNEGYQGYGKIKVNSKEELLDIEGVIQIMGKGDTEVDVEPYIDLKYDLHVQKIGEEYKTFIRRSISHNWKSNIGPSILEQIPTSERYIQYIKAINEHVGHMSVCSIDILISKEGHEYVHAINDVLVYYGESQEEDRRKLCNILKTILGKQNRAMFINSKEQSTEHGVLKGASIRQQPASQLNSDIQLARPRPRGTESSSTTTTVSSGGSSHQHHLQHQHQHQHHPSAAEDAGGVHKLNSTNEKMMMTNNFSKVEAHRQPTDAPHSSIADDTMSQLKRTFAGIFGDVN